MRSRPVPSLLAITVLAVGLAACGSGGQEPPVATADAEVTEESATAGTSPEEVEADSEPPGDADGRDLSEDALPSCDDIAATPAGSALTEGLELNPALGGVSSFEGIVSIDCLWGGDAGEVLLQLFLENPVGVTDRALLEQTGADLTEDPRLASVDAVVVTEEPLDLAAPLVGPAPMIYAQGARLSLPSLIGPAFSGEGARHTNDLLVELGAQVFALI